ncbi:MAG: hypothetical protein ACLPL5_04640 [Stellaceae bacterium]
MIQRRVLAACAAMSFLALSLALAACGPTCGSAPERQWPIWTGGGAYDDPSMYRGGGR